MRVSPVLLLLAGIGLPHACGGTAIVDPPDDDGGGGSGATTTTTTTTSSSSSMGGAPTTTSSTNVGPAPGSGPSTSSGMMGCIGCGDYLQSGADISELCGFAGVDQGGMLSCAPNTSCELLLDLQNCTCTDCLGDCGSACMGGEITPNCLGCVTNDCNLEFNDCVGDV